MLALGCSSASVTELVVLVRADVPVPDLEITVTGPDGTVRVDEHVHAPTFPLSVVLTRDHAPYGPVTVHIAGGELQSDAITDMVQGDRRRLEMWLSESCLCVTCDANSTCREGLCEDRHVSSSLLPRWVAGADAAVAIDRDAGPDIDAAPRPDVGVDAGNDGGTDAARAIDAAVDARTPDAAIDAGHDASAPIDAGQDAAVVTTGCGCPGQACCAGTCRGLFVCQASLCVECPYLVPSLTGEVGSGSSVITSISASGSTITFGQTTGTSSTTVPFTLGGGTTAAGSASFSRVVGLSGTGSVLTVFGPMGASADITFRGATISGSFTTQQMPDGSEGPIARVVGAGDTIMLTSWSGTQGILGITPGPVCP